MGRRGPQEQEKEKNHPVKEGNNHLRGKHRENLHRQYIVVENKEIVIGYLTAKLVVSEFGVDVLF